MYCVNFATTCLGNQDLRIVYSVKTYIAVTPIHQKNEKRRPKLFDTPHLRDVGSIPIRQYREGSWK